MKFFIMAFFLFNLFAYGQESYVRFPTVCLRTPQVKDAIVEKLQSMMDPSINCTVATDLLDKIEFLIVKRDEEDRLALQMEDFSGLTSLKVLDLSLNDVSSWPPWIFSGLTSLEKIFINGLSERKQNSIRKEIPFGVQIIFR